MLIYIPTEECSTGFLFLQIQYLLSLFFLEAIFHCNLICIPLVWLVMNIKKCMLGICKQIFEKYLLRSFAHFKMCSLCILDINPLWNSGFTNLFSHPVGFHLSLFLYRYFLAWCSYSCLVSLCSVLFCRIYNGRCQDGRWGTGLCFHLEAF